MEQLGPVQSLDQPDHRQRIPVTVVEQVSPDSVSFVLRNLVHDEEEPGDFDASVPGLLLRNLILYCSALMRNALA